MIIDCDTCIVRGPGCADCVMTVFLSIRPGPTELDDTERTALAALSDGGLLPPLRLVSQVPANSRAKVSTDPSPQRAGRRAG
jgi:hypothetical protein